MITLSKTANKFIKNSADNQNDETMGLRVAVYPDTENSCFNYGFGFDHQTEGDALFRVDDVSIIISSSQTGLLEGAEIDYVEMDDGNMHLIVMNPNDPSFVPPECT